MKEIIEQYKKTKNLHHFYILVGNKEKIVKEVTDFCSKNLIPKNKSTSAIFKYNFDALLIDEARKIISESQLKPEIDSKNIFIISFNQITREAQNSFLKCVEEPNKDTFFFFVVSDSNIFLPTILSRAVLIRDNCAANVEEDKILKKILAKSPGERMKFVETLVKEIKDEKKPKIAARELVESLVLELEKEVAKKSEYSESLAKIQKIYKYFLDQSCSTKILLEKVFLSLPK